MSDASARPRHDAGVKCTATVREPGRWSIRSAGSPLAAEGVAVGADALAIAAPVLIDGANGGRCWRPVELPVGMTEAGDLRLFRR